MDIGHSWDREKKASGIKDMHPNLVASGIFVRHKWWKISRIQDNPVSKRSESIGTWNTKEEEPSRHNPLHRTIHSANQLCIYGAVTKWCGTHSEEASQSRLESARKTSPETQIKQEDLKSLVDIPRLPYTSGKRMLQSVKDVNSMPFMSKINISVHWRNSTIRSRKEIIMLQLFLKITDGEMHVNVQRNTAPRNREDSRPHASIDAEQEIGPVSNVGIVSVFDVLGIEVHVPSLSSPGYSVWILISRGHERFVNEIHRPHSDCDRDSFTRI